MSDTTETTSSRSMDFVLERAREHSARALFAHNFNAKMRGRYRAFVEDYPTLHDKVIIPSLLHFIKQRDEATSLLKKAIQHLIDNPATDISIIAEMTNKFKELQAGQ